MRLPETYLGYERARSFASPGAAAPDEPQTYVAPDRLSLNQWALVGEWTVGSRACVLHETKGSIAFASTPVTST